MLYEGYVDIKTTPIELFNSEEGYDVLDIFQSEVVETIQDQQVFQDKDGFIQTANLNKPCCLNKVFVVTGKKKMSVVK